MAAYLLFARTAITDEEKSKRYGELVIPQIRAFGGEVVATRAVPRLLEGDWQPMALTVLKFADMDALMTWYESEEYAPLKRMRLESNTGDIFVIEGN
ncbi:MAG: DUF1330 domain-containing protein [Acidimicrobiales bacterium]